MAGFTRRVSQLDELRNEVSIQCGELGRVNSEIVYLNRYNLVSNGIKLPRIDEFCNWLSCGNVLHGNVLLADLQQLSKPSFSLVR